MTPWRAWTRYGVDWRWRTLQANRTQGHAIGQGMLYGYGGLGLLLTLLLGVPLARLTQRGRRIKPVGAGARRAGPPGAICAATEPGVARRG